MFFQLMYFWIKIKQFNSPFLKLYKVAWPSGLRRWFKAPVSSEAWVRIPPPPKMASNAVFLPYHLAKLAETR